jgi:hypothetical protein
VIVTAKDRWLYRNEEYIDTHERLLRESSALWDLLDEMDWRPSTPEDREKVVAQSAREKAARTAVRELRERLMAAHG